MAYGIFHERLEDQMRNLYVAQLVVDAVRDLETIVEAGLLDLQILRKKLQLRIQRDRLPARVVEAHAQEITQLHEHAVRGIDIREIQHRHCVQRIEQEVRLELHAQRMKLRVRELGLQLGGENLAVVILSRVIECVIN